MNKHFLTPPLTMSTPVPEPPAYLSIPEIPPFVVLEPFNSPSLADIVLRSDDGIDFYVSKIILAFASTFFHDMIANAVPSPPSGDVKNDPEQKDGLPVITMHGSTASVLDLLLRIIYPVETPISNDIETIASIAGAADKYNMVAVMQWVR